MGFDSEDALHRWLDSDVRRGLLSTATSSEFPRCWPDIIVVDGSAPATGVGLFRHAVSPERTTDFLATQQELVRLSSTFSGFESGAVLESDDERPGNGSRSSASGRIINSSRG